MAVVALRVDWILNCWLLHLYDRSHWCHVPYRIPSREPIKLWDMGLPLACVQSCCYGLHLVWGSIVYRRGMRVPDDPIHLAQLGKLDDHHVCDKVSSY